MSSFNNNAVIFIVVVIKSACQFEVQPFHFARACILNQYYINYTIKKILYINKRLRLIL